MNEEQGFKERLRNLNDRIYIKLAYFYEKEIPIHFCLINSSGWKNGIIKELKNEEYTMILDEFHEGELHFLLEEISINSIQPYRKKEVIL